MTKEPGRAVGDVVADRFELRQRLGSGAMGTVWRAHDPVLERDIALKEMRPLRHEDDERAAHMRERAVREAKALARLNHRNAVRIYEIVDDLPYPWLVMEFVDSVPLDVLLREATLTPAQTAGVGLDILGALRAAHAAGVLHRDVKPANVLIRPDGSAVLADFGIAALQGSLDLTATGDLLGSPDYLAPERISAEAAEVGPASDLWSLGVLLCMCVEGANPMRRDTLWETLVAIREDPLPDVCRAGLLGPLILTLLSKDPAGRPSAEEVARALAAVADGQPYRPGGGPEADAAAEASPAGATSGAAPSSSPVTAPAVTTRTRTKPRKKRAPRLVRVGVSSAVGALVLATGVALHTAQRGAPEAALGIATPTTTLPSAAVPDTAAPTPTPTATLTPTATVSAPAAVPPRTAAHTTPSTTPSTTPATTPTATPTPAGTARASAAATVAPTATPSPTAPSATGRWIAQLSVIPQSAPQGEADEELLTIQEDIPGAKILNSDDWRSLPSGNWLVYVTGTFPDGNAVLAFCARQGRSECFGRYLSHDADSRYICLPRRGTPGTGRDPESCDRP
ncbi:serine/threonine-protein kinase [Streptomyces sp. BE303]|uniref:serine/threonine-protein kinase n=1 Tax=Streptomyces sp. BE303 TaxID=3002528 RepID=UPI002E7932C1|nr:serine/threonine-protein kinase [Streptomyces sp. BE303]MED7954684.1 serine/threonine-protein kinase [Streptomyces sp. BE303]